MPLLTIWMRPTWTLEYLLTKRSVGLTLLIWFLAAAATAPVNVPNILEISDMGAGTALLLAFFISFLGGLIGWVVNAGLYTLVGKMLGGTGRFAEMLWIVPAATLPLIWVGPLNYIVFSLTGGNPDPFAHGSFTPFILFMVVNFITIGIGVYGIVIASKGIGLVHRFSAWRGFGTLAILMGVFFIFFMILFMIIGVIMFNMLSGI